VVARTPYTEAFARRLGAELGPPVATLPSRGDVAVRLKTGKRPPLEEIMDEQRNEIAAAAPGLRVEFVQVLADMLGDWRARRARRGPLLRTRPRDAAATGSQAAGRIQDAHGIVDLFNGDEGCAPEVDLRVDALQAGRQGLPAATVGDQLSAAMLGQVATQLRKPDHLEDVRVRLLRPPETRQALEEANILAGDGRCSRCALSQKWCRAALLRPCCGSTSAT